MLTNAFNTNAYRDKLLRTKLTICYKTAPATNQAENDIQLILKDFFTKISNMAMVLPPNG